MPWTIEVHLTTKQTLRSPTFDTLEEAEKELERVKADLGSGPAPKTSWLALRTGALIQAANIVGEKAPGRAQV